MASMNWPITKGTLCILLISSWARTNSLFKLLEDKILVSKILGMMDL